MTLSQLRAQAKKAYEKSSKEGKRLLDRALTNSMGHVKNEKVERKLMEAIIKAVL